MRFTKLHGLGNDYIYVDCIRQQPPRDPVALARAVSDRHFGVGGDGLILICRSERADGRMRMFNADGSESEMCGNGVRCVAKFMYDHGLVRKPVITVETGRGVLTLELDIAHDKVRQVRVDMGEPILEAERIPTTLPGPRVVDYPLESAAAAWKEQLRNENMLSKVPLLGLPKAEGGWQTLCGLDPRMTCVSMGNPHVMLYCRDVEKVPLEQVGPLLEYSIPLFPRRVNVHFVQVQSPEEVTMRTWERGSGITLACGTGACAVAVASVLTGRTGRRLTAHLPGGDLQLHWSETDNRVYMTGPATEVFTGEWPDNG
jgi:diaminopimelate epimerase